jgi:hypothetical protein
LVPRPEEIAVQAVAGEDAERVRERDVRGRERLGKAALNNRAVLQELRERGHDDRGDRGLEHWPPPA